MPGLITEAEMLAIHHADDEGRRLLFIEWLTQRGRPFIRTALRRIANRRGRSYLLGDRGFEEDVVSTASFAAWQAIVGYQLFCPLCRIPAPGTRYASKLHRVFATRRGLHQHGRIAHDKKVAPPPISRRVAYMIGTCIQGAVRTRGRYVGRYMQTAKPCLGEDRLFRPVVDGVVTGPNALPTSRCSIEVEDGTALERLAALERRLDRERKAAALEGSTRLRASWLLSGLDSEVGISVSSMRVAAERRRNRRI